jgi:predicted transposase YdaD
MFEYFQRLRSRYKSPVNALAIITDGGSGSHPKYEHLYDETKISYEYSVYQVREQSEKELLKSSNPFAFVILIAQKGLSARNWTDEEKIDYFGSLAKTIESRNLSVNHISMLYGFMNECVSFANPENHTVFNHILETITKRKNPMGFKEELMEVGRQEGRQEERQRMCQEVIAELLKNDHLDLQDIARAVHLNIEDVLKIKRRIVRQRRTSY